MFGKFLALTLPAPPVHSRLYRPLLTAGVITLGLAIAWLPVKTTGCLLGGAVILMLLLRYPILSLYLLIPLIPFSSLLAVTLAGFRVGLMEAILVLGLTAWLLQLSMSQHYPSLFPPGRPLGSAAPLRWPFLIFLGCVSLSWLNTLSIGASLVETVKWFEMLALYLLVIALLPAQHFKWVVATILLTGMAQAVLGLYQFIFKIGPEGFLLFGGRFLRAYGAFAQPNPYAGYLGLGLPLALAVAIWGFSHFGQRNQSTGVATRVLVVAMLGAPFLLMLAALFASQSRAAWLGFAIAALVTLIALSKKPAATLAILVLLGAVIFLSSAIDLGMSESGADEQGTPYSAVIQRFADALAIASISDISTLEVTDANFATIERLAHWQAAREMWRDHPWLGVGFGNYAVIYPVYAVGRWLNPLGHAHNYLLNIGAETGLVGISGYLIFWISTFGVTWLAVCRSSGFERAVAAGGLGILVHLHLHNLFDNLYVQGMYLHVAIILALISIVYANAKTRKRLVND
ncbi:MAG: O-antigen ligase family protein [Anaerolineae bacterium]|nr:O-antigen ligase family protein [Anaerolineae bacterium]